MEKSTNLTMDSKETQQSLTEITTEITTENTNNNILSPSSIVEPIPYKEIVAYLNGKTNKNINTLLVRRDDL